MPRVTAKALQEPSGLHEFPLVTNFVIVEVGNLKTKRSTKKEKSLFIIY